MNKIQEYTKNNNFKDLSNFVRDACQLQIDFIDKQKYFKDNPKESLKYLDELGLKLDKKKIGESILAVYIDLEEDEKERLFLNMSLERKARAENKLEDEKHKHRVMTRGGELEPKVGYTEITMHGISCYLPITPDSNQWNELVLEDKQTLLAELRTKMIVIKRNSSDQELYLLKKTIEEISKEIGEKNDETVSVNDAFFKCKDG